MPQGQPSAPQKDLSQINSKIDQAAEDFFNDSVKLCNELVASKVRLHEDKTKLKQKLDQFTAHKQQVESQIAQSHSLVQSTQQFVAQSQSQEELNEHNFDQLVNFKGAYSEKMAYLAAKELALEDTLDVLKKCFDKEHLPLQDYLRMVRQQSERQFKAQYR